MATTKQNTGSGLIQNEYDGTRRQQVTISNPGHVYAVTPGDATDFEASLLYVGNGGNIQVIAEGQATAVTFENFQDGTFLPIKVTRVYSTSTTATAILRIA